MTERGALSRALCVEVARRRPQWTWGKPPRSKLDTPVSIEGLSITRQITRVVWRGNPKQGGIIRPRPVRGVPDLGTGA